MKKTAYHLIAALLLVANVAQAQFAKPLSEKHQGASSDAQFNVGIFGGVSATRWLYQGGANPQYEQPYVMYSQLDSTFVPNLLNNSLFGMTGEWKFSNYNTLGLEVAYARRSTQLSYQYTEPSISGTTTYNTQIDIAYSELFVQIPLTQYLRPADKVFRPYIFIAPRITVPIKGGLGKLTTEVNATPDTIANLSLEFNSGNMRRWNVGAVAGLGMQFRIDFNNAYYFMLKLDASCHYGILDTYSKQEREGTAVDENGNPINPYMLGTRHIGNATVKLSILFPLKKIQKDACKSWGEYD